MLTRAGNGHIGELLLPMLYRSDSITYRWTDESYGAGGEKVNVSAQLDEVASDGAEVA